MRSTCRWCASTRHAFAKMRFLILLVESNWRIAIFSSLPPPPRKGAEPTPACIWRDGSWVWYAGKDRAFCGIDRGLITYCGLEALLDPWPKQFLNLSGSKNQFSRFPELVDQTERVQKLNERRVTVWTLDIWWDDVESKVICAKRPLWWSIFTIDVVIYTAKVSSAWMNPA